MPDWFYRTVSRPLLFQLAPPRGRDLALNFMGTLARLPGGSTMIDLLGHMRADDRLRCSLLGASFPSPLGLGTALDGNGVALPALARFGFGFLEVGPIAVDAPTTAETIERLAADEALRYPALPNGPGLAVMRPRLIEAARLGTPIAARLTFGRGESPTKATDECRTLLHELSPHVQFFTTLALQRAIEDGWSLDDWLAHVRAVVEAARAASPSRPLLLCVPSDLAEPLAMSWVMPAIEAGLDGLVVDGAIRNESGGYVVGAPARAASLSQVKTLRRLTGEQTPIIASGGVHEPADALEFIRAGADLVQADSGLVFTGPGLPKRINDALLYEKTHALRAASDTPSDRSAAMSWFWTMLMGLGMLAGSLMALAISATQVVLPYDEAFVGMSRDELLRLNPRLLDFMAHDRVTLAGTMISLGVLYSALSWFGVRRGQHWAQWSVFASAFTGFATFFLFLGFGYLDTLHAFVTAVLLQLLLLGVHARLGTYVPAEPPLLRNERSWRLSQWGQLLLVFHACALLGAGLVISGIGVTHVFVHEDLEFMQTTAEHLRSANPRLVPLVAHDRATFGGMLLSNGVAYLLTTLWGFRNGSRWLVWTYLVAGVSAYSAAIGVHFAVGYTDLHHLLPAFAGLAVFLLGLGLSAPYLAAREEPDYGDGFRKCSKNR